MSVSMKSNVEGKKRSKSGLKGKGGKDDLLVPSGRKDGYNQMFD